MRPYFLLILLLLPLISLAQRQEQDFLVFQQLKGTWQIEGKAEFEHWYSTNDYTMKGMGYSLKNQDTIVNELLELKLSEERIEYTATVVRQNNGQPVKFTYKEDTTAGYIFENRQHDFPQVIVYDFKDKNTLLITLKGQREGQEQTVQFTMLRSND